MLTASIITRGRPDILAGTLDKFLEGIVRPDTVIHVAIDEDDEATVNAKLPVHERLVYSIQPREDTRGLKHQRVLTEAPADFYLIGTDHTPVLSKGWDEAFQVEFPDGIGVVSSPLNGMSFPFIQCVTKRWVELTGYVQPTHFPFWFIDDWTDAVAKMTGRYSMVDVEVNSDAHPQKTIELRDVPFWAAYYISLEEERIEQADRIIDAMDEPEWRKAMLRSNFPRVTAWDNYVNDRVIQTGPRYEAHRSLGDQPWAGYVRAKNRALAHLNSMVEAA